MPRKDGKQSSRSKGLPKAAKQAAKAIRMQSANKQGKTYLGLRDLGINFYSGAKSGFKYKDESRIPKHKKLSGEANRSFIGKKSQHIENAREKFKASQAKLAGKKMPSLGIAKRKSRKIDGGYKGMRPGPLKD